MHGKLDVASIGEVMRHKRPSPRGWNNHNCQLEWDYDTVGDGYFLIRCRCHDGERWSQWKVGDPQYVCQGPKSPLKGTDFG